MTTKYVGIDDANGRECWSDVAADVIEWVTVAEHDELIATGFIDMDGKILVEIETED